VSEPLTRAERDALLKRVAELKATLYPGESGRPEPKGPARLKMMDTYYQMLAEYGDRLPRVAMSRCPLTQQVLKRSLDPYGLDGPWWHKSRIVKIEEPPAPPTFKVLLGALALNGRTPSEATQEVTPGPEVPFVVPRLLELPGMVAVVARLDLANGDVAYPVGYFSSEEIRPERLHQHWLRQDLWFKTADGGTSWLIQNDPYDYELGPWIEREKLLWIRPGDADAKLVGKGDGEACPYLGLDGERLPQSISGGERAFLDAPNGQPFDPYAEFP
jgi:hypothetical protein